MTDPIQAAVERLTKHVEAFQEAEPRSRHLDDVTTLLAEISRLEGENERLQDPMYCPICNSCGSEGCGCEHACKYAMAHPEVVARVDELEADLADARRQIAERDEALRPFAECLPAWVQRGSPRAWLPKFPDESVFNANVRVGDVRRAAALLAPGEGKGEDSVKRGDVRVQGDKLCRFIEHDDRGEVWEIIGPAPVHEQGEG